MQYQPVNQSVAMPHSMLAAHRLVGAPHGRQREFSMADYMSAMEGTNVVKTVFLETDAAKDNLEVEASFVGKLCADPSVPVAGAVIGCSLDDSAGFKEYIDKMRAEPFVKGVRDVMHPKEKGFCLKPEVLSNIRYLGECGLSCDVCIQPDQLSDCAEMVRQCPGTTFISALAVCTSFAPAPVPYCQCKIVRDSADRCFQLGGASTA